MRLRFYRFMESMFYYPASYFGDLADNIDPEFHQLLREAMKDVSERIIASQPAVEEDAEYCVVCKTKLVIRACCDKCGDYEVRTA